jgi:hypothetical protein
MVIPVTNVVRPLTESDRSVLRAFTREDVDYFWHWSDEAVEEAIQVARILISVNMTPEQVTDCLPAMSPSSSGSAVWPDPARLSATCKVGRMEHWIRIEWSEERRLDVVLFAGYRVAEVGTAAALIDESYFFPLFAWVDGLPQ